MIHLLVVNNECSLLQEGQRNSLELTSPGRLAPPSPGQLRSHGRSPRFLLRGLTTNLLNPKAALFYVGVLPGFFDVGRLTRTDIAVIVAMSGAI